jgi:hypothetical protein
MRRSFVLARALLGSVTTLFAWVGLAHAQPVQGSPPAEPPPAQSPDAASPAKASIGGLQILATAGFGASTDKVRSLEFSPYGPTFGLDAGFTFGMGLRLGGYFAYGVGHGVAQTYDPLIRAPFDVTVNSSSVNGGISVGYDIPLYFLLMRYSVGLGVTSMSFDFGDVTARRVRFDDVSNPSVGFHVAPGAAVLFPYGLFEGGIGFDYLIQVNPHIPSGFIGKLLVGVRL